MPVSLLSSLFALTALGTLVVGLGILVYLFGSFALMRAHATARGFRASLRALLREAFWVVVTQPLLPLFYFIGRRLDGRARSVKEGGFEGPPIVLVHGYMHNRVGFLGLARALAKRGRGPLYAINYPWFESIERNAERLSRFVDEVRAETQSPRVDVVCHSMGGLVAMEMIHRRSIEAHGDASKLPVRRCVTIATPHAGVNWRGPILGSGGASLRRGSKLLTQHADYKLSVPVLSIYSSHDNIVFPALTSQLAVRGGRDVEVPEVAHLSILFSSQVADATVRFLAEPDPARAAGEAPSDTKTFVEEVEPAPAPSETPSSDASSRGRSRA